MRSALTYKTAEAVWENAGGGGGGGKAVNYRLQAVGTALQQSQSSLVMKYVSLDAAGMRIRAKAQHEL